MSLPRTATVDELIAFHNTAIALDGGALGIRDRGALEAAAARPQSSYGGVEHFPTAFDKAAAIMESIIQRHPFVDGNKRTGLMAGIFLLSLAGYEFTASQQEAVSLALDVATHKLDTPELAQRLRLHTQFRGEA